MSVQRAQARINVAAIERNCVRLRRELRPGVQLCAVVKGDGYGHGVLPSARAALAGGASWLAVAAAEEACELRRGGITDAAVLVMGALTQEELEHALAAGAEVVAWHERDLRALARAGGGRVHVKLDSGMGRLGTRDPAEAWRVLALARELAGVRPVGAMTHFATADEPDKDDGFFESQLVAFARWANEVKAAQPDLLVHAANSAAVLRDAGSHFDAVRCGIAIYGMDPFGEDPVARALEPVLELTSYIAEVKRCAAGQSAGYGRRFIAERDTYLGVLPIGYGDGWRRGLSNNADVLIAARRYPLVGTVSMDNTTVDLGPDPAVEALRGEPATLIGRQGEERITAEEVARRLGTINYEVTCGLTPRVDRAYHRDGTPVERPRPDGEARGRAQPAGASAERGQERAGAPAPRAADPGRA
jgi:alanine racemase